MTDLNEYRPSTWTDEQWTAAIQWAVDNTWLSDHEDEHGNLNEDTYEREIEAKVSEYVYEETLT